MITKFKIFENSNNILEFKILDKKLMNLLIDDIYKISSKESDINEHWRRWCIEDFLCDLPGKWEFSQVALLNNQLVAFQINSLKSKNGINFVHTNRILKDRKYKDIHLFKDMYESLFSLIKNHNLPYWTCFTPFEKVKDMCVEILGATVATNVNDFMDRKVISVNNDGKLIFDDMSSLYFLLKKI